MPSTRTAGRARGKEAAREGYLPFSRGARVCPGAGFAMLEGTLLLAHLVRAFRFEAVPGGCRCRSRI
jgi:cytochrome P450